MVWLVSLGLSVLQSAGARERSVGKPFATQGVLFLEARSFSAPNSVACVEELISLRAAGF